jgi:V8-like Glu-specific endopeptidase
MADIQDAVRLAREQHNTAAEQRFRASAGSRGANARTRKAHGTGVHDELGRLQARAALLAADEPKLADVVDGLAAVPPADQQLALERIIDASSELQSWTFLPRGARAARPVARVSALVHGRDVPIGTGFLVSPTLVMTNNHVLPLPSVARQALVELGVELDIDNRPQLPVQLTLDPRRFFFTDVDLDVTVVSVASGDGAPPGESFGWATLGPDQGSVVTGEELNIVGHPGGRLKEIAIRDNRLVAILAEFLQYTTDTETGNSGSPVFNNQWQVVALHHASVAKRDAKGRRLRKDGKVWREGDGEDAVWWVANEGIRIGAILERLAGADLAPAQAGLRDELFRVAGPSRPIGSRPFVPRGRSDTDHSGGPERADVRSASRAVDALAATLQDLDAALAQARSDLAVLRNAPEMLPPSSPPPADLAAGSP